MYTYINSYSLWEQVKANEASLAQNTDAGFVAFSKFASIGDSLSVGYYTDSNGVAHSHDKPHSWGKYVEKLYGAKCYWTGVEGATSKTWLEQTSESATWGLGYAQSIGAMPLYFVSLGANEGGITKGTQADITAENPTTLYGYVGKLFRELRTISPNCYIVAVGCSREQQYADSINAIYKYACTYFNKAFYYDIQPTMLSEEFHECYYSGHYSALGYMRMAVYFNSVLNEIMSNNVSDFKYINDADPVS